MAFTFRAAWIVKEVLSQKAKAQIATEIENSFSFAQGILDKQLRVIFHIWHVMSETLKLVP